MSGTSRQIGPYVVEREIGRGGMGVVSLARDSRLDRAVAIKELPQALASDPQRLARFEREARTLASLSHPNLAGIYGVEEENGARYLVLEYVEGETLADRLDRGAMELDDALEMCAQMAAGVEAAHEAGVIHRDLKPANVTLTPDGKVKVLDFGLAKVEEGSSSSGLSHSNDSPTLSMPSPANPPTVEGAIVGTPAYMSPEQARGRRVDRRTDVWSFGCILFECLTGRSPFLGETPTDTMGAILHKEVEWDLLPRRTPRRVRELLERTLERDRERRLRSLGDAMLELEAARGEEGSGSERGRSGRRVPVGLVAAGVALGLVAGAGGVAGVLGARGSELGGAERDAALTRGRLTQVTNVEGVEAWGTLSPDGSIAVYASDQDGDFDLYSQRVGGSNAINLTPESEGLDIAPQFSPDGQSIAFRSDRDGGGIFLMGATGESPRRLTDFGFDPAWSPDGETIVFAGEMIFDPTSRLTVSPLWTVDVATGRTERIFEGDAVQPRWSPSGERIAFWRIWDSGGQRDLMTIKADGSDPRRLTSDSPLDWNPVWSADGRFIFFGSDRGGNADIWRIPVDESTGEATGRPEPVTRSAGSDNGLISLSADGSRLLFTSSKSRNSIKGIEIDVEEARIVGEGRSITRETTSAMQPAISPDGEMIAYSSQGARQEDIVLIKSDGTGRRSLTNDAAKDRGPAWGADGETVFFYSDRGGEYAIWRINVDGSGLRRVVEPSVGQNNPILSPDGETLLTRRLDDRYNVVDLTSDPLTHAPLPQIDGSWVTPLSFSPDGERLLVVRVRNKVNLFDLMEYEFASGEHRLLVEGPLEEAIYLSDGRHALVARQQALSLLDLETLEMRSMEGGPTGLAGFVGDIDVAPDDSWICFPTSEPSADLWLIDFNESDEDGR